MKSIPLNGSPYQDILDNLAAFKDQDANYMDGRTWSLVYHLNKAQNYNRWIGGMRKLRRSMSPPKLP